MQLTELLSTETTKSTYLFSVLGVHFAVLENQRKGGKKSKVNL